MNVLIFASSYERIKDDLKRIAPTVQPVVMAPDGRLSINGEEVSADQIELEVAWPNIEVHNGGAVREFMTTILKSQSMKWVQTSAAGVEHPVFAAMVKNGATLTNSDAGSVAIAEYVMASVLDHYHPFERRRKSQAEKVWDRVWYREIFGTNWVIIGFGKIGSEIAKRAHVFGANVTGIRRSDASSPYATIVKPDDMLAHLPTADVVVVAAALTPETHHIINRETLNAMSPDSVLINIGRGGHVDEAALLESLDRGIPGTAILDVFEEEPLPAESPIWTHPRIRLTAHSAAMTEGLILRNDQIFLENLKRYLDGDALLHPVNPALLATDTENIGPI